MGQPGRNFCVIYRIGGNRQCQWVKVHQVMNAREAQHKAESLKNMGYKTVTMTLEEIEANGLPVGWEDNLVDKDQDMITLLPNATYWRHRELVAKLGS